MKNPGQNFPRCARFGRLYLSLCLFGLGSSTHAADTIPSEAGSPANASPAIQFTVIASKRARVGNHSVVYNRVAPPQLPVTNLDSVNPPGTPISVEAAKTLPQLHTQQQQKSELILIEATVFNHQTTEFSWTLNGATYRGYSNIDFTVLTSLTQLTSDDTVYTLLLLAANRGPGLAHADATAGSPANPGFQSLPQLPPLTATESAYVVVSENGQMPADDILAPIDALHDYFDAHRDEIIAARAKQQADLAAQIQWAKEHPPLPQDTVINFWPIKSQVYGNSKQ